MLSQQRSRALTRVGVRAMLRRAPAGMGAHPRSHLVSVVLQDVQHLGGFEAYVRVIQTSIAIHF
jgi:hypothetical protein